MDEERLKAILESLLFAAGEPVSLPRLAAALDNVPREEIRAALAAMNQSFYAAGRALMLEEVAGGYQLRTNKEYALYVRRLLAAKPPRLTRPTLETLAIVAYRQPVTRPEVEQLRGVDSGAVLDNLQERQLIKVAGRKEAPGRPLMYATTAEFLELFGLKDLSSLPDLSELREVEQQLEAAEQYRASEELGGEPSDETGQEPAQETGQEPSREAGRDPSQEASEEQGAPALAQPPLAPANDAAEEHAEEHAADDASGSEAKAAEKPKPSPED